MIHYCLVTLALRAIVLLCTMLVSIDTFGEYAPRETPMLRQPIALSIVNGGKSLVVANQRSGSLSTIDLSTNKVVSETIVGSQLAALVSLGDGRHLLTVDAGTSELIIVSLRNSPPQPIARLSLHEMPVFVSASPNGNRCFVSLLWARQLAIVDLTQIENPRVSSLIDLPMAPRSLLLLPDRQNLVVADSFGGNLARLSIDPPKLASIYELDGHNIRGMAIRANGQSMAITHQRLSSEYTTTLSNVHWGDVLLNVSSIVNFTSLSETKRQLPSAGQAYFHGVPDSATGDPHAIAVTNDGRQIISFAGISQVGISDATGSHFKRIDVGRRPTALAVSPDERHVYVANTFDDTISVVGIVSGKVEAEIPLGPRSELTRIDVGEMLFYDARLSSDGWFSCHSCHTDGHSNGLLVDNLSDDSSETPKRILSLLGTADTGPWAWNGQVSSVESQVRKSIEVTMQGPSPTQDQVDALTAYLRSLTPPLAVSEARQTVDRQAVRRGANIFERQGCIDCHVPDSYSSTDVFDVGIHDEADTRAFNPPSLRGVSQALHLLHDNRAKSLRDLFRSHQHGLAEDLSSTELHDLLSFLKSI